MLTEFKDQYLDVLQNIEWALLSLVKEHPELSDHDMLRIIEQALTYYKSQQRENLVIAQSKLTDIRQDIFERIRSMCEWRLERLPSPNKEIACNPIIIEELLLCLKRIEKSIKFWTKQGGRKGYINFAAPRALASC
ncbi:MAG: hypothetical protein ACM3JI_03345 [Anaerolineae bacterium]